MSILILINTAFICRRYESTSAAAVIHLYNDGTLVASLYFYYDAAKATQDPAESHGRIVLYNHISMLDSMIDMLRKEDSVYLNYNLDMRLAYLTTRHEEVGEEET